MDTLTATKKVIVRQPNLVFQFYNSIFSDIVEFELTKFQNDSVKAVLANCVGRQIHEIAPKYRLGRVLCLDCVPQGFSDPTILYAGVDQQCLIPYYSAWISSITGHYDTAQEVTRDYEDSIRYFVQNCKQLTQNEILFSVLCMLQFKNEVILGLPDDNQRADWWNRPRFKNRGVKQDLGDFVYNVTHFFGDDD